MTRIKQVIKEPINKKDFFNQDLVKQIINVLLVGIKSFWAATVSMAYAMIGFLGLGAILKNIGIPPTITSLVQIIDFIILHWQFFWIALVLYNAIIFINEVKK